MITTNLKFNLMQQELKSLRIHHAVMRDCLRQIASSKRGGLNKRLARSTLTFLDACTDEARKGIKR